MPLPGWNIEVTCVEGALGARQAHKVAFRARAGTSARTEMGEAVKQHGAALVIALIGGARPKDRYDLRDEPRV